MSAALDPTNGTIYSIESSPFPTPSIQEMIATMDDVKRRYPVNYEVGPFRLVPASCPSGILGFMVELRNVPGMALDEKAIVYVADQWERAAIHVSPPPR